MSGNFWVAVLSWDLSKEGISLFVKQKILGESEEKLKGSKALLRIPLNSRVLALW